MTRADDLRRLIGQVEDKDFRLHSRRDEIAALLRTDRKTAGQAVVGCLNAVAQIEAPLRERGWQSWVKGATATEPVKAFMFPPNGKPRVEAKDLNEACARLLAALQAMLHEEEPR